MQKKNVETPSKPKPFRFLIPPKPHMSDSERDTSNYSDNTGSPLKRRSSSTKTNRIDMSPRSEEDFDDFRSPTYPKSRPSPQRIMVSSSTISLKKETDREAFIRDYEEHTAEITRYPRSAPHWKGNGIPPTWMTQKMSASALIIQQVFLIQHIYQPRRQRNPHHRSL